MLKAQHLLDKALLNSGQTVQWSEFSAGLPMLEALTAGAIDFAYFGEAPAILAQSYAKHQDDITSLIRWKQHGRRQCLATLSDV